MSVRGRWLSFFSHNACWLPSHSPPVLPRLPPVSSYRYPDRLSAARLLNVYLQLSKSRLTALVVLTAMSGVALSPSPTTLPVLLSTAFGTALCSASANTLNQLQEVPFDAQMPRTRSRPLVRRAISPLHAAGFAAFTGVAGPSLLWTMVNPSTAVLGIANVALYAGVYTWMKRNSALNTWLGAVVGALPPLMGWVACDAHALSCM
jgi:protoheme IX farnesyltransferase